MIRRWKYGNPKTGDSHIPTASAATTNKRGKNPKNRTQSVKHVPGLKCKTCPRLDREAMLGSIDEENKMVIWLYGVCTCKLPTYLFDYSLTNLLSY